jgi:hypothetical protein
MGKAIFAAMAACVACVSMTANAEADGGAVEVGLRTGYALPLGDATGGNPGTSLGDVISGMVPIWIDAGYRLNSNLYIGADFQYGITFINNDKTGCGASGANCSSNDLMFGVNLHYHLMPSQIIDPWLGAGIGYEILNLSQGNSGEHLNGFQFFNLQVGGDYKVMPNLAVGPFVTLSFAQFSSCGATADGMSSPNCSVQQQALHEWLTIGVRGAYDIGM